MKEKLTDYTPEQIAKAVEKINKRKAYTKDYYAKHAKELNEKSKSRAKIARAKNKRLLEDYKLTYPKSVEDVSILEISQARPYSDAYLAKQKEATKQRVRDSNKKRNALETLFRQTHPEIATPKNNSLLSAIIYKPGLSPKEKRQEYFRQRYLILRHDTLLRVALYQKTHPEVHEKALARRRALCYNAPGSFTPDEFISKCLQYNNKCVYCGKVTKLTPDHVLPLSRGGSNSIQNILPACKHCNSAKGAKTFDEYVEYVRRFIPDYTPYTLTENNINVNENNS